MKTIKKLLVLTAVCALCSANNAVAAETFNFGSAKQKTAPAVLEPGKQYVVAKTEWASYSKANFDTTRKNLDNQEELDKLFKSGVAFKVKKGLEVIYEGSPEPGVIRITPVGKKFSFWTFSEALMAKPSKK